jgi:hypothetical protein
MHKTGMTYLASIALGERARQLDTVPGTAAPLL